MRVKPLLLTALVVAVLAVAGSAAADLVFLRGDHVPPLALPSASPSPSAVAASSSSASAGTEPGTAAEGTGNDTLTGTWTIAPGSIVGYRVREQLASLSAESDAVGRTEAISGELTLSGDDAALELTSASFSVDMTTLTSDRGMRDNRLRTSGIETDAFPTSTFVLTAPVSLPAETATGAAVEIVLAGDLTLHGVTRAVSIPAQAQLVDGLIQVAGSLTFPFADFEISAPNIAGFVSVEDEGALEFLVSLQPG